MSSASSSAALGSIASCGPLPGWLCRVFEYETHISHSSGKEYILRRACIHCATSPCGGFASVNYFSYEDSGWHGKCKVTKNDIYLSFNARGEFQTNENGQVTRLPMRAAYLWKNTDDHYEGFDYAGRYIKMNFLGQYKMMDNSEWVIVTSSA